jgi:hypothetical protein
MLSLHQHAAFSNPTLEPDRGCVRSNGRSTFE